LFKTVLNKSMENVQRNLAELEIGEKATICCIRDEDISVKLFEMGCLPGAEVKMCCRAPFGGPVCFSIAGYQLSLRVDEASRVMLQGV
jgi:ferrous iron transport protein A